MNLIQHKMLIKLLSEAIYNALQRKSKYFLIFLVLPFVSDITESEAILLLM